ncbi:MAG TPA: hypothetical protein VKA44_05515, partial [Gemmatimonadota bacterium]|nr:hypothetical protein [Gemmatimonadota bacterium]
VTDLNVHGSDLVVATQGRSFWILDDVTPLRQLADSVASADHFLFQPRPAYRASMGGFRGPEGPDGPPGPAVFDLYVKQVPDSAVAVEVTGPDGTVAARWSTDAAGGRPHERSDDADEAGGASAGTQPLELKAGENRLEWDLRYPGPDLVEDAVMDLGYTGGPWAVPGPYTVHVSAPGWTEERTFEVRKDPRLTDVTGEDLQAQFDLATAVRDTVTSIHDALRALRSARGQVEAAADRVEAGSFAPAVASRVRAAADSLADRLDGLADELHNDRIHTGEDGINYPPRIDNQLDFLYGHLHGAYGRPTEGSRQRFTDLEARLAPIRRRVDAALTDGVGAFNRLLDGAGVAPIVVPSRADTAG